jgi:hypothetical protein
MKGKRKDSRAAGKPKPKAAKRDRVWFERKVAELEKLPANRQEQLRRELEEEPEWEQCRRARVFLPELPPRVSQ